MNKVFFFIIIPMLAVSSCFAQTQQSLDGIWKITDIEFKQDNKELDLKNILANSVATDGFKPEQIEIRANQLILKSKNGEMNTLDFKIIDSNDSSFTLATDKGEAKFNLIELSNANLTIAGATYRLKK